MLSLPVGELKASFAEVLDRVRAGETVQVLYGRSKKPVAKIVPYSEGVAGKRPVGMYEGTFTFTLSDDFKFRSYKEFLGL